MQLRRLAGFALFTGSYFPLSSTLYVYVAKQRA